MKRLMKFLHEMATVAFMGALAVQLIMALTIDDLSPDAYVTVRLSILAVSEWLLLPSLVVVLGSGILALVIHRPYHNAPWAWMKAAMTTLVLEGTLMSVQGPAQAAARLSAEVAAGNHEVAQELNGLLEKEQNGVWIILGVCVLNIALAIWRPRFRWLTPK